MPRILLIALFALLLPAEMISQVLGTPLYNWDFGTGIPAGWENGSTSGIGVWEYRGPNTVPSNAVCSRGSCGTGTLPPASQTLENGYMIFDSNYWDDDGPVCGNLGAGQDPAPHTAWLTTESINLTGTTGAVITFQQQVRMYQATTKVQVSVNQGAWTDVVTNTVNNSPNVEWKSGNVSALAAGQPDVRFRFLFTGIYYHWCIDDITVYRPNQNDVMINSVTYTNFGQNGLPNALSDMEYDQIPQFMLTPFNFRSRVTNIGSNAANSVQMNVKVLNQMGNQIYSQNSNTVSTLNAGASATLSISAAYNPPTALGDYTIPYQVNLTQADQNLLNNRDTLDFTVTANTYARDEGPMENVFVPQAIYQGQTMHIGNMFEIKANGYQMNSIGAAVGTGTQPGMLIKGFIYNSELNTLIAESDPVTVPAGKINSLGEEKIITIPFSQPFVLNKDSIYCVMVGNVDGSQPLRVCRSGSAPANTSFVRYPETFGLFYLLTMPVVRMNIYPLGTVTGCMDPEASNFNPAATFDDTTCQYPGCMNPEAQNYDPQATVDDGSCLIAGCTNPVASNYNPGANLDDGSCILPGCTDELASNYDPAANEDDGSCIYPGCTDPEASNFDPQANENDGSCIYPGCMDPEAANYDPQANTDDGSCLYPGCMDEEADNYDPDANTEDGSCIYTVAALFTTTTAGCAPYTVSVVNQTAMVEGSSCVFLISDGTVNEECVSSFFHTFTEPGEYFITLQYTSPTGYSEAQIGPIVVSGFPPAPVIEESGDLLVCTNCTGDQYSWTYNGVLLEQETGPEINVLQDGIYQNGFYRLTAENEAGCSVTSAPYLFLRSQFQVTPLLGCTPFEITLDDITLMLSGMTCTFTVGDEEIPSTGAPFTHTVEEGGEVPVTLTCSYAGSSASSAQVIQAFAPVTPELSFDEVNGQVVCSNCSGVSSVWEIDGQVVANDVSTVFVTEGLVEVSTTSEGGCGGESSLMVVNIHEQLAGSVRLYPNPANESCTVETPLPVTGWWITDPSGRLIEQGSGTSTRMTIHTGAMTSGFYLLRLRTGGQIVTRQFAVAH
jgi:hypothetical protein